MGVTHLRGSGWPSPYPIPWAQGRGQPSACSKAYGDGGPLASRTSRGDSRPPGRGACTPRPSGAGHAQQLRTQPGRKARTGISRRRRSQAKPRWRSPAKPGLVCLAAEEGRDIEVVASPRRRAALTFGHTCPGSLAAKDRRTVVVHSARCRGSPRRLAGGIIHHHLRRLRRPPMPVATTVTRISSSREGSMTSTTVALSLEDCRRPP